MYHQQQTRQTPQLKLKGEREAGLALAANPGKASKMLRQTTLGLWWVAASAPRTKRDHSISQTLRIKSILRYRMPRPEPRILARLSG